MRETAKQHVYGVIPAAGQSRRMGESKLLMAYQGRTVIDHVVDALSAGGLDGFVVVGRADVAAHLSAEGRSVAVVRNDDPSSEMIDSIRMGLRYWREDQQVDIDCGFLVMPADHPGLSGDDVAACASAYRDDPESIVVGSRDGRRGHPVVFSSVLCDEVFSDVCDEGLNGLVHKHEQRARLVESVSRGAMRDVDTPEDFQRLDESSG